MITIAKSDTCGYSICFKLYRISDNVHIGFKTCWFFSKNLKHISWKNPKPNLERIYLNSRVHVTRAVPE